MSGEEGEIMRYMELLPSINNLKKYMTINIHKLEHIALYMRY